MRPQRKCDQKFNQRLDELIENLDKVIAQKEKDEAKWFNRLKRFLKV